MATPEGGDRARRLEEAIRLRKAGTGPRPPEIPPRPAGEPALLGDLQRSLWLVHRLDPLSPAYNLARAFRVRGGLDPVQLRRAADAVVSRHRILRSTFRAEGDRVVQVVHPPAPVPLPTLVAADGEGPAAAARAAREPFDLERGPLVRMSLVEERPGGEQLLLIVLHHILADERSLGVLWKDLAAAYDGGPAGADPPLQYDDYVHWMRQREGRERDEALDDWRRRLDPLPDDLRLPFERKAAGGAASRGRLLSRALARSVPEGVRRLAAATGTTPFAVLALAFRLLLQRYTDGQRVAFATPVSARSHPATADMVGYFLNPVVVSSRIDEDRRVEDALRGFGGELRADLARPILPFDRLAEALSPPRQRDRHPLFQAMFVLQDDGEPPALGDARLEPVPLDLGESKFDLTLFATGDGAETAVEYRTDRFEETWMRRLLGHYEALLAGLSASLSRQVADVPTEDEAERARLGTFARGAALDSPAAVLLPGRILEVARRSPEAEAVSCGGRSQSCAELVRAGLAIAGALARAGVRPGDRVGLFVERSVPIVAAILGCHWAGAAYVPLDPGYPETRNGLVLDDADVAAVLTSAASRARLPAVAAPGIDVAEAVSGDPLPGDPATVAPDSPAYILYTSGSTGRPKGVVVTHGSLAASTAARLAFYDAPPGRFLLVPSVAFDSSVAGIFWTLATAGTLVVPTDAEARDARRLAKRVADEKVTSLLCVPSLYAEMLRAGPERLRGLEVAIVAGETCPSRLVEEHFRLLPSVRLFNEYGPTEATVWATVHEASRDDAARPVSIGRPIPGVRVDLLDGRGRPVPAGIPGHAILSGPTVARGYWRRPDLTGERFEAGAGPQGAPELRYRTGDRMAWTEDGRLLFLGREDDQIKLRGFRIEPGEIEAALLECAGVEEAAVVARPPGPASPGPEALVAFVRAGPGGVAAGWRRELATRLPDHMIPSRLVALGELPRLPNGKVDRRRLRDLPLAAESGPGSSSGRPPSVREQALLSLWEGLLGRSGIGPHDNFFELGGHSLLAVEMALAVERDFEAPVSAADVFENPTVHGLLRRIDERGGPRAAPYRHLFPIQPHGRGTPFVVAVPHFFAPMLAARFRGERPVYGLRGVSLRAEGNRGRWPTLRHLGEELVEEIGRRFPGQACILAGYSFGASMAVEAARILEERGRPPRRLFLVAPMAEDFLRLGPLRLQIDGLRQPVSELTAAQALGRWLRSNDPLTRRPYERAFRFFAIQPWRRLVCLAGTLRRLVGLPLTPAILHADIRVERFRLHAGYRPGVVRTPTVVFNAREPGTDAAATWRPFFAGPFEVVPITDPHDGGGSVEEAQRVILDRLKDLGDGEGA